MAPLIPDAVVEAAEACGVPKKTTIWNCGIWSSIWQPPEPLATVLRFCGRYSLEIYAATLLAMQITAYAIEDPNAEDEIE